LIAILVKKKRERERGNERKKEGGKKRGLFLCLYARRKEGGEGEKEEIT